MLKRTDIVRGVARAVYHQCFCGQITEDEAWRDADEYTRGLYLEIAYTAVRTTMLYLQQSSAVDRGACICRAELSRGPSRGPVYEQRPGEHYRVEICKTCGGTV